MHVKESSVCFKRDLFPLTLVLGIILEFQCTNGWYNSECLHFQKTTSACSGVSDLFIFAYGENIQCIILPSGIVKIHKKDILGSFFFKKKSKKLHACR